ncbi:uncharacterized protein VDAG_09487 [Verticillium dahliae VdLs.17]|uniref:Uncharacterized protein n=1 Tax=Verticillium dahliae (strain VdLs.17 / ATCC MYA-4575 / FGSC 10137) TaxID=498257 RepID=G2XH55_VERDV|nr:uncharacterized protein VDAG_09487 [Verticillium dahliae VdLs.17]EGY19153.1 hypothetical protein VDAG_09487 [Verticillium dahliae VdLs.17]
MALPGSWYWANPTGTITIDGKPASIDPAQSYALSGDSGATSTLEQATTRSGSTWRPERFSSRGTWRQIETACQRRRPRPCGIPAACTKRSPSSQNPAPRKLAPADNRAKYFNRFFLDLQA